jgi:SAM-dependent methyltransferase
MSFASYKSFWDDKASTALGAMAAVDGSTDEAVLRATGGYAARQIRAALELHSTDRVLELGCGVARIGRELAPHVGFWQGVDISANMVAHARERLSGLANTDVQALTRTSLSMFADASFDKAYCVAVFIHMDKEDFVLYLRELHRVLKPGGRVYFDVWNLAHPIGWKRFAYEVAQYTNAEHHQRKDVARNQFSTPQEVSIYLRHCGFETVLQLDDSPQLQAIARVPGAAEPLADVALRAARVQHTIAYGPRWGQLFERVLHVLYDGEHPKHLYAELDPALPEPEIPIFRVWLRSLWQQGEAQWGPAPKA